MHSYIAERVRATIFDCYVIFIVHSVSILMCLCMGGGHFISEFTFAAGFLSPLPPLQSQQYSKWLATDTVHDPSFRHWLATDTVQCT